MTDDARSIGPYVIEREIGRGGMGIVYLARDPRLERAVALKALPDGFATDPERIARFEREARLLASVKHPNIATIHGLELHDGRCYLVLEYIEGETLSERLERGPLPVREAIELCRQVAAALEAAHESGVIHRDLKPANVRLTPGGEVKVLDFGLAKGVAATASGSAPDLGQSPTLTRTSTALGMILGTAAYMSPEQARGRAVDRRTDIWSFGCLLYECFTGRQAFAGETVSDSIAAILERDPDWNVLPSKVPERVRDLLRRCLEKDPKRRCRDIGDARLELDEALANWNSGTRSGPAPARRAGRRPAPWVVPAAVAAGLLLGAGAMLLLRATRGDASAKAPVVRLSIAIPNGLQIATENMSLSGAWDLSPDGTTVAMLLIAPTAAFGSGPRIFLRSLDRFDLQPLVGTELATSRPEFSADGHSLFVQGQLSVNSTDSGLWRIPVDHSTTPILVTNVPPQWAGFVVLPGGDFLFTTSDGRSFVRVPAAGGPTAAPRLIECGDFNGTFSFVRAGRPNDDRTVFLRTIHYTSEGWHWGIAVLDPVTAQAHILREDGGFPVVLPSGHLLYSTGETIQAVRFDRRRLEIRGQPVAILDGIRCRGRYLPGMFMVSTGGTLAYIAGGRVAERRSFAVAGLDGRITPLPLEKLAIGGGMQAADAAPRLAFTATNPHGIDEIWIHDLGRTLAQRLVAFPDADCASPAVSADGQWVAFRRNGLDDRNGIYVQNTDGTSAPRRVLPTPARADTAYLPTGWSPDGREILVRITGNNVEQLAMLRLDPAGGNGTLRILLAGFQVQGGARFAPDGHSICFGSIRGGQPQIYVCSYDPVKGLGEPQVVGPPGAFGARFWRDGHTLAYRDSTWIATSVRSGSDFAATPPKRQYDLRAVADRLANFEILPDGRTVLALLDPEERRVDHLEVVLNWSRELQAALAKSP